ncbi:LysR family transcriptional regulator [Amycolatopsis acidiphila]|uniref:LysR family transcriptional regulator n=1 Tax=Amycolatopsis acidiphila TaxID=715473 RepID=A0A557ZZ52_9PSEU|nr:LysR family transcriptional regulator [Amycolatopsis acidiphila]TVT17293.1 LysR family transcriptional regulator [Amycolatopsis acidiphila]UIJ61467.1 LysR family transcriptional regulator [Amycolatopsis acidiphila]GHG59761.1 LysR family transcriptional regulator [Amycolatopsis acidiphila]
MELRTLRYFVAVAEHGSVSAAAEVVHVTQPALSRQVRQLEHELRLDLFDRRGNRLELSAAGAQFLPVARDVLQRADDALSAAEAFAAGHLVRITIAAPTTTLTDLIAPFLATFGPADPLPTVVETSGTAALRHGADLAIVTQPPQPSWGRLAIARMPLWAYVPEGHPWWGRERVPLAELVRETLVVLDPSFRPRQILQEALTAAGLATPELVECGNAQVAQALAAAGRGVAVVSDDSRFGLHGLRIDGAAAALRISLFAAWAPSHHAAGSLAALAQRLRAFAGDRYGADVLPVS